MDAGALRPLGIGELLDVSIKLYRARFTTLAKAVAVVVGPVYAFAALVNLSLSAGTEAETFETVDTSDVWTYIAAGLLVGIATFVAGQLATAATFKILGTAYLGEQTEWNESVRFAFAKIRSLLWLTVVFGFLVFLGFLACIVPGVYFAVAWSVAFPVLFIEDLRGTKALRRSRSLVEGSWWRVFAAFFLAMILTFIVSTAVTAVFAAALVVDNEVVLTIAEFLGNVVGSVVTTPFTSAVIVVIYFDLRVRKEGFDLELLARRVGVEPPPPGMGRHGDILPPRDERPSKPGAEPPFWPPPPGWRPPDE